MKKYFKYLTILILPFLFSCDKDLRRKEELIGAWISQDAKDTLEFIDFSTFTKNGFEGWPHFYGYDIEADIIEIQYNGPNMILVLPSTHHFSINGNSLSLDFSNYCYGFERKNYEFIKEE
ncbi:MAG: hypothetical protein DRJ13_01100 [Bacteroidetes bacterium]|nr:MAG: hypothetical protein DRJ13_01100 [Bacteroidota bacterium]